MLVGRAEKVATKALEKAAEVPLKSSQAAMEAAETEMLLRIIKIDESEAAMTALGAPPEKVREVGEYCFRKANEAYQSKVAKLTAVDANTANTVNTATTANVKIAKVVKTVAKPLKFTLTAGFAAVDLYMILNELDKMKKKSDRIQYLDKMQVVSKENIKTLSEYESSLTSHDQDVKHLISELQLNIQHCEFCHSPLSDLWFKYCLICSQSSILRNITCSIYIMMPITLIAILVGIKSMVDNGMELLVGTGVLVGIGVLVGLFVLERNMKPMIRSVVTKTNPAYATYVKWVGNQLAINEVEEKHV